MILKRNAKKVSSTIYNYNIKTTEPGWSKELGYGLLDVFQSLIDPLWDQNVNYTNTFGIKGGTIFAGKNVTTSAPFGDVIIGGGGNLTYLAFKTIEIYDGFEVNNNGEFLAEVYIQDFPTCGNWDKVEIPILGEIYEEIISDFKTKPIHSPLSNNLKYIAELDSSRHRLAKPVILEDRINLDFVVYPNPNVGSLIKVKFSKPISNSLIEIRDLKGEIIFNDIIKFNSEYYEFNLSNRKPGIYCITIEFEGLKIIKRMVLL